MKRIARGILNVALAVALAGLAPQAPCQGQGHCQSSLLLIDVLGSMGDAIGSGKPTGQDRGRQAGLDRCLGRKHSGAGALGRVLVVGGGSVGGHEGVGARQAAADARGGQGGGL